MDLLGCMSFMQGVAFTLGVFGAVYFLYNYRRVWNLSNSVARFVVLLNVSFIAVAFLFICTRFYGESVVLQAFRALALLGLSISFVWQPLILSRALRREERDESEGRDEPTEDDVAQYQ